MRLSCFIAQPIAGRLLVIGLSFFMMGHVVGERPTDSIRQEVTGQLQTLTHQCRGCLLPRADLLKAYQNQNPIQAAGDGMICAEIFLKL